MRRKLIRQKIPLRLQRDNHFRRFQVTLSDLSFLLDACSFHKNWTVFWILIKNGFQQITDFNGFSSDTDLVWFSIGTSQFWFFNQILVLVLLIQSYNCKRASSMALFLYFLPMVNTQVQVNKPTSPKHIYCSPDSKTTSTKKAALRCFNLFIQSKLIYLLQNSA